MHVVTRRETEYEKKTQGWPVRCAGKRKDKKKKCHERCGNPRSLPHGQMQMLFTPPPPVKPPEPPLSSSCPAFKLGCCLPLPMPSCPPPSCRSSTRPFPPFDLLFLSFLLASNCVIYAVGLECFSVLERDLGGGARVFQCSRVSGRQVTDQMQTPQPPGKRINTKSEGRGRVIRS